MAVVNYSIAQGEYVTLKATVSDSKKQSANIEAGHYSKATVSVSLEDEANANVNIDSTNQNTRFTLEDNEMTVKLITSQDSENLVSQNYYYDWWERNTSTQEKHHIQNGVVTVTGAVSQNK